MLKLKRVYEKPERNDGVRILVDRLWPRGIRKDGAKISRWMKEIAPSNMLRQWFAHKDERWQEFKRRYIQELKLKNEFIRELKLLSKNNTVTLLYSAKDKDKNNAQVLLAFLRKR